MLFFTGFSRFATDFAQDQVKNIPEPKKPINGHSPHGRQRRRNPAGREKATLRELGELVA